MTSRSRTRRHRSTPQIAPRTNFFSTLPSARLELARTTLTTRLSHSPAPLLSPSRSFLSSPPLSMLRRSRRGRDSKLRICFSTSLFTFSRRRAQDEWGRRARRVNRRRLASLTLISPFLPSFLFSFFFFSFLFSFSSSPPSSHSIRMDAFLFHRSPMMNGYWNKVMPMLMLRNVSKLGEYDFLPLRHVNISFENTFVFTPWSIKCSRKSYYCFPIDTFRQV